MIGWSRADQRCRDLAAALGVAPADVLGGTRLNAGAAARHLVEVVRTLAFLVRRRPGTIVVQAPPADALLLVLAYARARGVRLVVDAHTGAFLEGRVSAAVLRLAGRRALATIVATPTLARRVRAWGGRPIVLHEPPPRRDLPPARPLPARVRVVAIGQLAADEPVAALLAAARTVPDVDLVLLGATARLPPAVRGVLGETTCPGFLVGEAYAAQIATADIIVALTDRREGVMRGACEAVWHGRPLVTSRTATAAVDFPHAILVASDVASIAGGIIEAIERHAALVAAAPVARAVQAERWQLALAALQTTLRG